MFKGRSGLLAALLALLLAGLPVAAAQRLALVIGNDTYAAVPDLTRAQEDAAGYAIYLRKQGFAVTLLTDLDQRATILTLARFRTAIEPGDIVAFVYAGHGWSDGRENFLAPTDMPETASIEELRVLSIPLRNGETGILGRLALSGAAVTLAIVGACRDTPFRSDKQGRAAGLERGLVPLLPPEGTFVAFSAGQDQTALDRLGPADREPFSVFTRYFLAELRQGGDLVTAMKATQVRVRDLARSIGHLQRPAYYDEIVGRFCLGGPCPSPQAPDPNAAAARDWRAVEKTQSIAVLEAFKRDHADAPTYLALAEESIARLRESPPPPTPPAPAAPAVTPPPRPVLELPMPAVSSFRDCAECPELVAIPAGTFVMGSPEGEEVGCRTRARGGRCAWRSSRWRRPR